MFQKVVDAIGNLARGSKNSAINAARNLHAGEGGIGEQLWGPFRGGMASLKGTRDAIRGQQGTMNATLADEKKVGFFGAAFSAAPGQASLGGGALEKAGSNAFDFLTGARWDPATKSFVKPTDAYQRAMLGGGRALGVSAGLAAADLFNPFGSFMSIRD